MPNHRTLQPTEVDSPARSALRLPSTATLAITGLLVAEGFALCAALLPSARVPFILLTLLVALPSAVTALRSARSSAGRSGDLAAATHDAALTDSLTGAGNAEALDAALAAAVLDPTVAPMTLVRLALRTEVPSVALASDLAHNERADRGLVLAAIRWLEILRPDDLLARLDGHEFAVFLPRCDERAVATVIGRLSSALPDGAMIATGVATWDGQEPLGALRLRAEAALDADRESLIWDPFSDPARVAAVAATGLARRQPHAEFDEIAGSVAWLLQTPVVVITLFDETWQHFIGESGVSAAGGPLEGTPARDAICRQTVATGRPLIVSDTSRHPELQNVPASRHLGVRACASVPVTSDDGHVLGSVCAMVLERHAWTADDVAVLRLTAKRVADRLAETAVDQLSAA